MEKIDMERASEKLEYLDALIEKYQSKLQTITVNDIFKQELKRSLASLKLEKIKLIKQIENISFKSDFTLASNFPFL